MSDLSGPRRVRFGQFQFDFETARLLKNGVRVRISTQPAQILATLLKRSGELVTRDELRVQLWGNQFSDSEHSLNVAMAKLREALGDSADDPSFILTVPRQGYRFIHSMANADAIPNLPIPMVASRFSQPSVALLLLAAVTAAGGWIAYRALHSSTRASTARVRLAVLPFQNLGRDFDQEYFCDGLTEEMINHLGQLQPDRLAVIARSSVMRYKQAGRSIRDIGRELGVDFILEGSVRGDGTRARVSAQLIQVRDQSTLWTAIYESDYRDGIGMQADIARRVAGGVRLNLSPEPQAGRASPVNGTAYEEYLRGRYQWGKRNKEGLAKALDHFERAIRIDPAYASAYSGLADTYLLMVNYDPAQEVMLKAQEAARKALDINPLLAEAHASLGLIAMNRDWDWAASEREYRRALEINANYPTAHHWYAELLNSLGRFDEALDEIARARELDPLSLIIMTDTGKILCYARRFREAIDWLHKVLAEDPGFEEAHFYLIQAYASAGRFDEALADLNAFEDPNRGGTRFLDLRASVLARAGRAAEAKKILGDLELMAASAKRPMHAIRGYAALGEHEKALAAIEDGVLRHNAPTNLKVDPMLDRLRSDRRFTVALQRMRLE